MNMTVNVYFLNYILTSVRNWGIQWQLVLFHLNLLLEHFSTSLMGALTTAGVKALLIVHNLERESGGGDA